MGHTGKEFALGAVRRIGQIAFLPKVFGLSCFHGIAHADEQQKQQAAENGKHDSVDVINADGHSLPRRIPDNGEAVRFGDVGGKNKIAVPSELVITGNGICLLMLFPYGIPTGLHIGVLIDQLRPFGEDRPLLLGMHKNQGAFPVEAERFKLLPQCSVIILFVEQELFPVHLHGNGEEQSAVPSIIDGSSL